MITRRSFFSGLVAALVAPKIVRKALDVITPQWRTSYSAWIPVGDADTAELLKQRMNDAYAEMACNISANLYSQPGDRERVVGRIAELAEGYGGDSNSIFVVNTADWRYLTVRESLLERSEHHFQRAAYWRIQGKPDYAMGSLYKAARAEDRARSLLA